MFLRAIERMVGAAEAYQRWYARSRYGRPLYANCPVCGANNYTVVGSVTLVNYRYQSSRLRQRVICNSCKTRVTMTSYVGDRKWSATDV